MLTLLETCSNEIDFSEFVEKLVQGLNDPSNEIKILVHLTIQKLASQKEAPHALLVKFQNMIEPLKTTLSTKCKPSAVQQEIEKNNELLKSAARTVITIQTQLIDKLKRGDTISDNNCLDSVNAFEAFARDFPGTSGLESLFASVKFEVSELRQF